MATSATRSYSKITLARDCFDIHLRWRCPSDRGKSGFWRISGYLTTSWTILGSVENDQGRASAGRLRRGRACGHCGVRPFRLLFWAVCFQCFLLQAAQMKNRCAISKRLSKVIFARGKPHTRNYLVTRSAAAVVVAPRRTAPDQTPDTLSV